MRPKNRRTSAPFAVEQIPEGTKIQEVLPAFSDVTHAIGAFGEPYPVCPGCGKPFSVVRRRRQWIDFAVNLPVPLVLRYGICQKCAQAYRKQGAARESLIAKVQTFLRNDEGMREFFRAVSGK